MRESSEQGRLRGISFEIEHSVRVGETFVTQWIANAPILAEPDPGSDAYIPKKGYMQAMVTTFDGAALK